MSRRRYPEAGQATVEYLVVAVGVLIALAAFEVGGRLYCIRDFGGSLEPGHDRVVAPGGLADESCESLPSLFNGVLRRTVEDVTFLINLPF